MGQGVSCHVGFRAVYRKTLTQYRKKTKEIRTVRIFFVQQTINGGRMRFMRS